jgi:hypothetical protein
MSLDPGLERTAPEKERVLLWALILLLWLGLSLPLASGHRTLYQRDVFTSHLPFKSFGAEELKQGRIPAVNPRWGLGQPYRGNPNALAFYPGNLLYLVLPFWSAFNLHYMLHWLLAFLAMRALARELGQGALSAFLAGLTYAGSGWVLTALTFYNILAVTAWWPLAILGASSRRPGRLALGGLAAGMALLGGEPLTAAIGMIVLVAAAILEWGWLRGLLRSLAVGALALAVSLPQIVATARIVGFSFRGAHGVLPGPAQGFSLYAVRLLELIVPMPFGWPTVLGDNAFQLNVLFPQRPLIYSIHVGVVALALALCAGRRRWVWSCLAASSLLLAWLAGHLENTVSALTLGIFRHPEKFLFVFFLVVPLLSGWGLERLLRKPSRMARALVLVGAAIGAVALSLLLGHDSLGGWLAGHFYLRTPPDRAVLHALMFAATLLISGLILVLVGRLLERRQGARIVALQLLGLLLLAPLWQTDSLDPYRKPSSRVQRVGAHAPVLNSFFTFPRWNPIPTFHFKGTSGAVFRRMDALDLGTYVGAFHGLSVPLAPDLDGISSVLHGLLIVNLPIQRWDTRVKWCRALGVEWANLYADPGHPDLLEVEREERYGRESILFRIRDPAPKVFWPEQTHLADNPAHALTLVNRSSDPVTQVIVAEEVHHRPGGRVRLVTNESDRVVVDVDSEGGLLVLRRSYHPIYRAAGTTGRLRTLPVNLVLLGVDVPPGRQRVELSISSWPESVALVFGAVMVLGLLAWAWIKGRRGRPQSPSQ